MTPEQFEAYVASLYNNSGYTVEQTPYRNDYGVDLFASKANKKIAIQVKMFGDTSRSINRQMVMELYGAMAYFDCTSAEIAMTGTILSSAQKVANKLGIKITTIDSKQDPVIIPDVDEQCCLKSRRSMLSFDEMWLQYIVPLKGKELCSGSRVNIIMDVDWGGIKRISSKGKPGKIDIEIFKLTYSHLLEFGSITRDYINQQYAKRASSGVVLIMSQVPFIEVAKVENKLTLIVKRLL